MAATPEVLLISAVLRTGDYLAPARAGIDTTYFNGHRAEWQWIEEFAAKHKKAPSRAVFRREFADFTIYKTDDVGWACEEVKRNHLSRALTKAMSDAASSLKADDPEAALMALHRTAVTLERDFDLSRLGDDLITDTDGVYEDVSKRAMSVKANGIAGVPIGFKTLDSRAGGLQTGLHVVAARLGHGKTWTMLRAAAEAVANGKKVQYDALEMTKSQVGMRFHRLMATVLKTGHSFTTSQLATGMGVDLLDYRDFLAALPDLTSGQMHVSDTQRGGVSPLTIASQIEANDPDVVFVDYLTLMDRKGDADSDWLDIAHLTGELKNLAHRYDIPIVVASQLNRSAGAGNHPGGAENLSRSDAVGQDADSVTTYKKVSDSVLRGFRAKDRHGQDGYSWWIEFKPDVGIIEECSYDRAQELKDDDADKRDAVGA